MKKKIEEMQSLPLYGIGPFLVVGMALLTLAALGIFHFGLRAGILPLPWRSILKVFGGALLFLGLLIWREGALLSNMNENIRNNHLNTEGIYSWVRNPMYSGFWLMFSGIGFLSGNVFLLAVPLLNWGLMTLVLKRTEEVWLLDRYGEAYREYRERVNRCIPWKSRR